MQILVESELKNKQEVVSGREISLGLERNIAFEEAIRAAAVAVPRRVENARRERWWRSGRRAVALVAGVFDGGRMVREVGPGQRPLERYEFESPDWRIQRWMR